MWWPVSAQCNASLITAQCPQGPVLAKNIELLMVKTELSPYHTTYSRFVHDTNTRALQRAAESSCPPPNMRKVTAAKWDRGAWRHRRKRRASTGIGGGIVLIYDYE